jgi:hypothetical protein
MTDTIFFRLLDGVNRPSRLAGAVQKLHKDGVVADAYSAEPESLRQVPGSPFAYWVSDRIRELFREMPPLESEDRTVRIGASTKDDFRWLRLWWECPLVTGSQRWIPIAKGGQWSPYYSPLYLVVDWKNNGDYLGDWVYQYRPREGHRWGSKGINAEFYYLPGITWPRRTAGLSFRVLPRGCVFSDKGPSVFTEGNEPTALHSLCALMNSRAFRSLVAVQVARVSLAQSFEAGLVQTTPVPHLRQSDVDKLAAIARECFYRKREKDTANEASHVFYLPALLQAEDVTLAKRLARWQDQVHSGERQLAERQREIDDIAFQLYGIEDRRAIEESLSGGDSATSTEDEGAVEIEDAEESTAVLDSGTLVADLLSYAVGCVFGRWDARIALDPSLAPKLQDPFAPLPVCSPGMLVGPDGLPAQRDGIASEEWMRARPDVTTPPPEGSVENPTIPDTEYPLAVDWDGILVDDPEHDDDILRRVREVLDLLWGERVDEIEGEARELLGVRDLRTYFRNPRKFFDYHIKRYSKSRRKAPIYWLLQSPKRNYGLWLYYHRLDPDILFKALKNYVEPKVRLEESRLEEYEARRRSAGTGGREAKQAEKAVEKQEELLTDLREFRDRLERAAKLHLRPDLNDGVVLNIAPLHELVSWKEAKSKWNELLSGKYEWSSIGKQLREKGMV